MSRHYRKSAWWMGFAVAVLMVGFIAGWAAARQANNEKNEAKANEAVAQINYADVKQYVSDACDFGRADACRMLDSLNAEEETVVPPIEGNDYCESNPELCRGPRGFPGFDGADGRDGRDGTDGRDGKNGRRGVEGEIGDPGPQGFAGEPGPQGPQGPPGEPGSEGPAGKDGTNGQGIQPGTYNCGEGEYLRGITIGPEGGVTPNCAVIPTSDPILP